MTSVVEVEKAVVGVETVFSPDARSESDSSTIAVVACSNSGSTDSLRCRVCLLTVSESGETR